MGQVLKIRDNGTSSKGRAGRARAEARATSAEPRASLYDEVTAQIVAELEAGRFPWIQPWDSAVACPGLPRNAVTGRSYSGVNVLILWGEVIAKGYANQGWLTFRQALAAGGCVRKPVLSFAEGGERGVTVCYADRFTPEAEKERAKADGDEAKAVPFLKRFVVFNVAQCDGLPDQYHADAPPLPEREQVPVAESLIAATGADFRIGGARAFYCPSGDFAKVPPQPAFRKQIDYYRTALHELGHWTGHASRLARTFGGRFGDHGLRFCARTIARSSRPRAKPAKPPTTFWPLRMPTMRGRRHEQRASPHASLDRLRTGV